VFCLAKDWERATGYIPSKEFKVYLKGLELPRSTYSRWIREAYQLGLFQRAGKSKIKLLSWAKAGALAGCSRIDAAVYVDVDSFIGKGWKAVVWACFLKNHEGIIARATLKELSGGVSDRTQRARERKAGVHNHTNYATYGKVKDNPDLAIATWGQAGFYQTSSEIRRRLPNSRTVLEAIQKANLGRKKKINNQLAELLLSDATSSGGAVYRLYSENYDQTKRMMRAGKNQNNLDRPKYIFERIKTGVYYAISL
jgi:hypothetical protein